MVTRNSHAAAAATQDASEKLVDADQDVDQDTIAIFTGLYQEESESGRKLAVLICSAHQRSTPFRPFFIDSALLDRAAREVH